MLTDVGEGSAFFASQDAQRNTGQLFYAYIGDGQLSTPDARQHYGLGTVRNDSRSLHSPSLFRAWESSKSPICSSAWLSPLRCVFLRGYIPFVGQFRSFLVQA